MCVCAACSCKVAHTASSVATSRCQWPFNYTLAEGLLMLTTQGERHWVYATIYILEQHEQIIINISLKWFPDFIHISYKLTAKVNAFIEEYSIDVMRALSWALFLCYSFYFPPTVLPHPPRTHPLYMTITDVCRLLSQFAWNIDRILFYFSLSSLQLCIFVSPRILATQSHE